jgi:hypothetical protein
MTEYEWVSVNDAARHLGKSPSTIRRMIESGELVGEREPRAAGSTSDRYRVRMPRDDASPIESPPAPTAPTTAPAANSDASDEILRIILNANAETMDRQAARIEQLHDLLRDASSRAAAAEASAAVMAELIDAARAARQAAESERDRLKGRGWWARLLNRPE